MPVVERDRVRAYDVYVLMMVLIWGFGTVGVIVGVGLGVPDELLFVAGVPVAGAVGLFVRLFLGWQPPDRSLDRTVPDEEVRD